MATQLQLRKGTKVQNDAFTGAEGELTYDSTTKGIRIHDGITQGGHEIPMLIAVQRPTAENDYTWFRVWSDGWVEQGGIISHAAADEGRTTTMPIEMMDTNYTFNREPLIYTNASGTGDAYFHGATSRTTTTFTCWLSSYVNDYSWQVSGMAKLS